MGNLVIFTFACGIKVKAFFDMRKAGAKVRCPNPMCKPITIPGQITQLWVQTEQGGWREMDVKWLKAAEN